MFYSPLLNLDHDLETKNLNRDLEIGKKSAVVGWDFAERSERYASVPKVTLGLGPEVAVNELFLLICY
jgi:hypothetical protein